jgi:hypothetical protein
MYIYPTNSLAENVGTFWIRDAGHARAQAWLGLESLSEVMYRWLPARIEGGRPGIVVVVVVAAVVVDDVLVAKRSCAAFTFSCRG